MKIIIKAFLSFCLLATFVVACKKENSSSTNKSTLTLSKSSVKMGEPLVVSTNATGSNFTRWSVTPVAHTWISSSNNKTTVLFSSPGTYIVTASYFTDTLSPMPYDSSSSPVTVVDSVYNDTTVSCNSLTQVPINNDDKITLTPVYTDTGLVLLMHTQQTYGANYPSISFTQSRDTITNDKYYIEFSNVIQYPCYSSFAGGPIPATGALTLAGLSSGNTYTIHIDLNNVTYEGTLVVTNASYTFTWNYTSGVIISPLQINK